VTVHQSNAVEVVEAKTVHSAKRHELPVGAKAAIPKQDAKPTERGIAHLPADDVLPGRAIGPGVMPSGDIVGNVSSIDNIVGDTAPQYILTCAGRDNEVRWKYGERLQHLFEERCDLLVSAGLDDHLAVVTDEVSLTYQQLDCRANQTARYLMEEGVRPGDRVGVLFDRSIETYVALLAILKIGAAYIPFDVSFPSDRIAFILDDAKVGVIVTLSQFEPNFDGITTPLVLLDIAAPAIAMMKSGRLDDIHLNGGADQLCYIIYTSGTTGNPKGVAVEQASICNFIRVAGEVYGITHEDRVYQGMTIAFDFSVEELWVPLMAGATLVPGRPGTNLLGKDLSDYLNRHKVTAMCCVPTLLATLEEDLPHLSFLLVSGEACPHDLVVRWHRQDRKILNAYGPTEATVTATVTELYPDKPVTIGIPLPTYVVVILDENESRALAKGQMGEICIAGVGLAKEYVNRPDLTDKAFVEDFLSLPNNPSGKIYRTGDLGRITDGDEIEYHGRIDTQVKIRGYRIELTEIESVILQVPGIAQAVVNTYEPEPGLKELVAYYTCRADVSDVSPADIVKLLKSHLPAYMVPAYFEEVATIPMLPSNKADRKKLPAPKTSRYSAGSGDYVAPTGEIEEFLALTLADALKVERVSVADHFFDELGCHSLLMAQYCAKVRQRLPDAELSMRDIYLRPTVAQLALYLSSAQSAKVSRERRADYRKATNLEYYTCGTLQFLYYLTSVCGGLWLFIQCYRTVAAAGYDFNHLLLCSTEIGSALFVLAVTVPIVAKWLLIGRWTQTEIPIWGPGYFRFWLVRALLRSNPMVLAKGSPLYNVYLRLLGAKIGRHVVLHPLFLPVCTDLISIGDNTILRKNAIVTGYKAEAGYIVTGPVTIGDNVVVGEASLLDIGSTMGNGAQLAHGSALMSGQTIPCGQSWHGSPAEFAGVDYLAVEPKNCSSLRRALYTAYQLSGLPAALALGFVVLFYILTEVVPSGLPPISMETTVREFLASLAIFFGGLAIALAAIGIMSRILNFLIKEDKTYVLYGFHYLVFHFISGVSNNLLFNVLFGDSSYIVHYVRLIGYKLNNYIQSGSNFGERQEHDIPTMCEIGRGTMVSSGLTMVNVKLSSSSFRASNVRIGEENFLGNDIQYLAGSKVGRNCLLATKVMLPLHGEVRENVGLLGSPSFEIPRASLRDMTIADIDEQTRKEQIHRKNVFNILTMAKFLLFYWVFFFATIVFGHALWLLHGLYGDVVLVAGVCVLGAAFVGYLIFGENFSTNFRKIEPTVCSMYDPYFWMIEGYWKFTQSVLLSIFKGTPFRNVILRMVGIRVGKKVFNDGCVMEKDLVYVGDYCTLNDATMLQGHSLEEGVFKADYVVLGKGCTVGYQCMVHYGVTMGDNSIIEHESFVMKGEVVNAGETWGGNPAKPI
jgi:non-ribosomal peptide synthetase-like protein